MRLNLLPQVSVASKTQSAKCWGKAEAGELSQCFTAVRRP
jgi:hypothetical protein